MYFCQASDLLGECYHSYATLLNEDRIQVFNAFYKGLPESLCFTHNTSDKYEKQYIREVDHKTSAFLACDDV